MASGLNELADFLRSASQMCGNFVAKPFYEPHTDSLIYYARDVKCFSRRVNKFFTVFLADEDKSLVGVEIKGLKIIFKALETYGDFDIHKDDYKDEDGETVTLTVLARAALLPRVEVEIDRLAVEEFTKGVEIPNGLVAACA